MSTPKQASIHLALAAIIQDIVAIAKDRKNEAQKFQFRGIDDVYNSLHPIFAAHGVVCLPLVDKIETSIHEYTVQRAAYQGKPAYEESKRTYRSIVTIGYRFTATDGSFVEAKTVGEGMDFGDKATNKALSAAQKYLLLQTFLIPTRDIDEADAFDPTVDPKDELRRLREERAKDQVLAGGDNIELTDEQKEALEKKRSEAAAGTVQGTPVEPVDPPSKAKKGRAKAEKPSEPTPTEQPDKPKEEPVKPAEKPADKFDHVIATINNAKYKGHSINDLSMEELEHLKHNWADRFKEQIDKKGGEFTHERDLVLEKYKIEKAK